MLTTADSRTSNSQEITKFREELAVSSQLASELRRLDNISSRDSCEPGMASISAQEKIDLLRASVTCLAKTLSDTAAADSLPDKYRQEFIESTYFLAGTLDIDRGAKMALRGSNSYQHAIANDLGDISSTMHTIVRNAVVTFAEVSGKVNEAVESEDT